MPPAKVSRAFVRVSVRSPSTTLPLPESVVIAAPAFVPAMSNVPSSVTPDDAAMLPSPASARVAPGVRVVAPV